MAASGNRKRAAIVGGGIAGLTSAYLLGKAGVSVDLFEAEDEIGGLARSFDFDGLKVERYYHFICLPDLHLVSLASELGLAQALKWTRTKTTFFYEGKLYPFTTPWDLLKFYPLPFSSRLKTGLETVRWRSLQNWEHLDDISAKEFLVSTLGRKAYDVMWSPLLSMKFGEFEDSVSAAWLWHRIHRVANSRRSVIHPQVMGHFEGGTESLLKRLRERIAEQGSEIFCRTPVQAVMVHSGRVSGIRVAGTTREYDSVILTAPLPESAALLPDDLAKDRARLREIPFIGVVCLTLWLDQTISGSFWCNIHDHRIPMNGIIDTSKLNPATGRGGALVYVPHYLPTNSARFAFSDQELIDEFCRALPLLKPAMSKNSIRAFRIFRSNYAQAICSIGFLKKKPAHALGLKGLYLIDSTQMYPEDRTISGTIGLAKTVSALVLKALAQDQ